MTITARYESTCPSCSRRIAAGAQVNWVRGGKATHVVCPPLGLHEQAEAFATRALRAPEQPQIMANALEILNDIVRSGQGDLALARATLDLIETRLTAIYEARPTPAAPIADPAPGLRLAAISKLSKGIYRVSLNGREGRYAIDHVNVQLIPNPQYGSVKIAEYHGESVGRIDKSGAVRLWPDVDPRHPRTLAVLAGLEILLGAADPLVYAKAYAVASSTCWRCGADLVDEISRAVLMGPHCFKAEYGRAPKLADAQDVNLNAWVPQEVDDDQLLDSDPYDVDTLSVAR